jgi:hypothetical protein
MPGAGIYNVLVNPRALSAFVVCGFCVAAASDRVSRAETSARQVAQAVPAPAQTPDPAQGVVYICPMDPDVRSYDQGSCRRCGMTLVAGVPDPVEFHLDTRVFPTTPQPAKPAVLQFLVHDPWKERPVSTYNVLHERLFHASRLSAIARSCASRWTMAEPSSNTLARGDTCSSRAAI